MSSAIREMKRLLRDIERENGDVVLLREYAKFEKKLTPFGAAIVEAGRDHGIPQSVIARILDIDPSAVSRRYA